MSWPRTSCARAAWCRGRRARGSRGRPRCRRRSPRLPPCVGISESTSVTVARASSERPRKVRADEPETAGDEDPPVGERCREALVEDRAVAGHDRRSTSRPTAATTASSRPPGPAHTVSEPSAARRPATPRALRTARDDEDVRVRAPGRPRPPRSAGPPRARPVARRACRLRRPTARPHPGRRRGSAPPTSRRDTHGGRRASRARHRRARRRGTRRRRCREARHAARRHGGCSSVGRGRRRTRRVLVGPLGGRREQDRHGGRSDLREDRGGGALRRPRRPPSTATRSAGRTSKVADTSAPNQRIDSWRRSTTSDGDRARRARVTSTGNTSAAPGASVLRERGSQPVGHHHDRRRRRTSGRRRGSRGSRPHRAATRACPEFVTRTRRPRFSPTENGRRLLDELDRAPIHAVVRRRAVPVDVDLLPLSDPERGATALLLGPRLEGEQAVDGVAVLVGHGRRGRRSGRSSGRK